VTGTVAVVPVQVLLEQEEREDAGGDPGPDGEVVAEGIDRLGQHVEQRTAEQRACGERDEGQDELLERLGSGRTRVRLPVRASALIARPETAIHSSVDTVP
jgi:hypothetical protein